MIPIFMTEGEARALMQLMQLVVQRGCDMSAAEAALVINRRVVEALSKMPQRGNGADQPQPGA